MFDFQCTFCENDIQADYALIGEFVACPICGEVVIVPDPLLIYGSDYQGYVIERHRAFNLLWSTYQVTPLNSVLNGVDKALLRIPTSFFLKRISDFDKFSEIVIKSGTLGIKGISPLIARSLVSGRTYFVFEFFPSLDLNGFIAKTGPLDLINSLRILRRCAVALREAWNRSGLIHQNILPHNIRINAQREIRMMNLGISQFLLEDRSLLEQGFNIWDQRYISPEFALNGKGATPACDIYALGMVFFFLLTGGHPYSLTQEDKISESPIPDLKSELPMIPDDAKALFQLMVAKRVSLRLNNWDEVLERIDAFLHKSKKRMEVNDFGESYSNVKARTDRRKPVALAPIVSLSTERFKRHKNENRKPDMSETIARPVEHNRKTRHIQIVIRNQKREKAFFFQHIGLMVALIVAFFAAVALIVFWMSEKSARKRKTEVAVAASSGDSVAPASAGRKDSLNGSADSTRRVSSGKKISPARLLDSHLKSALKYCKNNPDDLDGGLKRLEAVIPEAVNLDRFDIVNVIREKTGIITARKAALEEDQIRKVIKGLRGRAAPMLKNGDYDKAARLVRDYDGPMRDESVFARKRLIDEINSVVESKKSLEKRFYDSTVKLARIIAPLLLCEKMEEAKKALSVSDGERIPRRLLLLRAKWLKAVISFESWSAANKTDHSSVEPGDAELNHSFSSKSALERGLIHSFRGEFDAAENAFKELSEPAAKPFIDALIFKRSVVLKGEREKRLRKEFSDILKSYSLSFDSDRPERLLSLLGKTRISKRKAIKLASEMSVFASKAAASDFMKENANLVDAIALFCKRNSGEGIDVPLLISAKVTLSPKSDLSSAFLSAKSGAAFRLTAGVFKIPRTVISAGDITISGSDGVVLTGGPLIVKGAKCFLEKLLFKGVRIEFQNSPSSRMMKCRIDAGALRLSRSNDFVLSDSFASAVIIEDSRRVRIFHSTIVSNDESVAALRVNAKEMLVVNSIIYGRGFAVSFLRDNTNRKCKFEHTLIFGEKALGARDRGKGYFKKRDIAVTKSRIRRFMKTKDNIYAPPQFVNHLKGDWRLVQDSPGTKAASDGENCGMLSHFFGKK